MFRKNRRTLRRKMLYNQKTQRSFIFFIVVLIILFAIFETIFVLEKRLRPVILSIAELKADILATDSINLAITNRITPEYYYKDLIYIEKDIDGRIVMAQINTMEVNRLIADTTLIAQDTLRELEKRPFSIPLGEVFDNYLLATYGPKIPFKLIPMGRVNTRLIDSFEEAGINQVRHKIYIEVNTEVRVIVPFIGSPVEVYTTIPLTDTIYPGEVPDTVINLQFP